MRRFYLPPEQCAENTLLLTGSEAHHAVQVRLRRDERVIVLDGAGREFVCETRDAAPAKVSLAILETRAHPPPSCRMTLLQALPKGQTIEDIIRNATELGAARIVPLLTERVVARINDREARLKAEKWQRTAVEAIKQCGLPWLPRVEAPVALTGWLARKEPFELPWLASLQPGSRHPRFYFEVFRARHGRPPRTACIWVGPEGDFTPAEIEAIQASGGLPITLGPRVLRTETAATYCLSVLNYELEARRGDAEPARETGVPGTGGG